MAETMYYVANARLPSRKAHPYQIVQMCQAFHDERYDVELVVPDRNQPPDAPAATPESYFDVPFDFQYTRLACLDFIAVSDEYPQIFSRLAFYLQAVTFAVVALAFVLRQTDDESVVYSRGLLFTILAAPVLGDRLVLEIHHMPSRGWVRRLIGSAMNHLGGVVVITEGLKRDWETVTDAEILVAPDGVRLDRFEVPASVDTLRSEFSLPDDADIVCYTGSLKQWKGVDTLIEAAATLPEETVVCIVGGTDDQRARLRASVSTAPENVRFEGHVDPSLVPRYLTASDVLVLPNSGRSEVSTRHTSPLKLFEYMASERPIVASDLPSVREVLDEETAFLVEPDSPTALSDGITAALADSDDAARRASAARAAVEQYTWQSRANRISETFINRDTS